MPAWFRGPPSRALQLSSVSPWRQPPPAHFFPDCSTQSCVTSRTNTCSAGLPPRSTVMAYVSTLGGGRGAVTMRGLGFAGVGAGADESVSSVAAVAPRVSTTLLSRRLRIASISLPSVCASPIFSAWFGASARVTVVTVTGLLFRRHALCHAGGARHG